MFSNGKSRLKLRLEVLNFQLKPGHLFGHLLCHFSAVIFVSLAREEPTADYHLCSSPEVFGSRHSMG